MKETEGALVGDRYRLDQPIGRGRAGIVWLAFDTMLHRTVAAKRVYLDPDRDPEDARSAALNGARQAMRVVHNSVITVYDAFHDGDDVWVVMEYVPSRNMADFVAEHGRLTPEQAAYLGVALGSALATAHAIGVTHQAVEPRNVLLADDGGVKLTDIGVAGGPADPAFQAPEITKGEPHTPASDAYSLGATLFAAVEGTPPFGEDGTREPIVPDHAGPLTGALVKLLRVDPDLRPTMSGTVTALRAISRGQQNGFVPPTAPAMPTVPVLPPAGRVAAQPSGSARLRGLVQPWRWVLAVVFVVAVVIVIIATT